MTNNPLHIPVLLERCIELLAPALDEQSIEELALVVQAFDLARETLDLSFEMRHAVDQHLVGPPQIPPLQSPGQSPSQVGVENDQQDRYQEDEY